jgi:hypothetical protein
VAAPGLCFIHGICALRLARSRVCQKEVYEWYGQFSLYIGASISVLEDILSMENASLHSGGGTFATSWLPARRVSSWAHLSSRPHPSYLFSSVEHRAVSSPEGALTAQPGHSAVAVAYLHSPTHAPPRPVLHRRRAPISGGLQSSARPLFGSVSLLRFLPGSAWRLPRRRLARVAPHAYTRAMEKEPPSHRYFMRWETELPTMGVGAARRRHCCHRPLLVIAGCHCSKRRAVSALKRGPSCSRRRTLLQASAAEATRSGQLWCCKLSRRLWAMLQGRDGYAIINIFATIIL